MLTDFRTSRLTKVHLHRLPWDLFLGTIWWCDFRLAKIWVLSLYSQTFGDGFYLRKIYERYLLGYINFKLYFRLIFTILRCLLINIFYLCFIIRLTFLSSHFALSLIQIIIPLIFFNPFFLWNFSCFRLLKFWFISIWVLIFLYYIICLSILIFCSRLMIGFICFFFFYFKLEIVWL